MIIKTKIFFTFLLFTFVLNISNTYSETTYFTNFTITNVYHQYIGLVTFENETLESGKDELGVYVSDDNNGTLLVGAAVIGDSYPGYYFVNVYGNDSGTQEKDGANVNDILTFKIWDKSNEKLYVLSNNNSLSVESATGINIAEIPAKFPSGFGAQYGYLNLTARNEDLLANIISFQCNYLNKKNLLKWSTSREINNAGFIILRKDISSTIFQNITPKLIPAKGNFLNGADYYFIDNNVLAENIYKYKLVSIDLDGRQDMIEGSIIQTITKRKNTTFTSNLDLNNDNKLNLPDVIELLKKLGQ